MGSAAIFDGAEKEDFENRTSKDAEKEDRSCCELGCELGCELSCESELCVSLYGAADGATVPAGAGACC